MATAAATTRGELTVDDQGTLTCNVLAGSEINFAAAGTWNGSTATINWLNSAGTATAIPDGAFTADGSINFTAPATARSLTCVTTAADPTSIIVGFYRKGTTGGGGAPLEGTFAAT